MGKRIDKILKAAMEQKASDIHLSAGVPPCFRVHGDLLPTKSDVLSSDEIKSILFEILTDKEKKLFDEERNVDRSYYVEGIGRFRCNIFETQRGLASVFRVIPEIIPSMDELGLPNSLKKVVALGKGLILVTGPTGSGKSTTLASMINELNLYQKYHILTVEDPVEFVHESKSSLVNQRQIGSNCNSFADALKGALREDPDVILVGEMRDLETIGLALTAAETGHIVFGTLHTRGAGSSIDRIIDSFPANQQAMIRTMLSESLAAVVSQSLMKKKGGNGRLAAFEILVVNHAISNLIREGKTYQINSVMQTARKEGMVLMDQYIIDLVTKGLVDPVEAEDYMDDPTPLATHIQKAKWAAKQQGKNTPKQAAPSQTPAPGAPMGGKKTPPPMGATSAPKQEKSKPPAMAPPKNTAPPVPSKTPPAMAPPKNTAPPVPPKTPPAMAPPKAAAPPVPKPPQQPRPQNYASAPKPPAPKHNPLLERSGSSAPNEELKPGQISVEEFTENLEEDSMVSAIPAKGLSNAAAPPAKPAAHQGESPSAPPLVTDLFEDTESSIAESGDVEWRAEESSSDNEPPALSTNPGYNLNDSVVNSDQEPSHSDLPPLHESMKAPEPSSPAPETLELEENTATGIDLPPIDLGKKKTG